MPKEMWADIFFKQMAVLLLSSYSASAFSLFREKQGTCYSQDVLSQWNQMRNSVPSNIVLTNWLDFFFF